MHKQIVKARKNAQAKRLKAMSEYKKQPTLKAIARQFIGFFSTFLIVVQSTAVSAQGITIDESAGRNTSVYTSENGTTVVDIATPSAQGLSHNSYTDFNVQDKGVILNNSGALITETQLGGAISGNANVKSGTAGVILNEVTSTNETELRGFMEVSGDRANVIVANPNGILCDGCGFANAGQTTLTTGKASISGGAVDSFEVRGGKVEIGRGGLNAKDTPIFDVISREIALDGALSGQTVRLLAGANLAKYRKNDAGGEIEYKRLEGAGEGPAIAISSTVYGGIYGDRVSIVATDRGAGVNTEGALKAGRGGLRLTSDGKLVFGKVSSGGETKIKSTQNGVRGKKVVSERIVTLDAKNSIKIERIETNNVATLNAGGVISFDQILAAGSVNIKGQIVSGLEGGSTKISDAFLKENSGKTSISSGNTITVEADVVTLAKINAKQDVVVAAGDRTGLASASAGGGVSVSAKAGDAAIHSIHAGQSVSLGAGDKLTLALLQASGDVSASASVVDAASITSGSNVGLEADEIVVGDLRAAGDVKVTANNDISAQNVSGTTSVELSSAGGNIRLGQGKSAGQFLITAPKVISVLGVGAKGVNIEGGEKVDLGVVTSTADARIHSDQVVAINGIGAFGKLDVSARDVAVATARSGGALKIDASGILNVTSELRTDSDLSVTARTAVIQSAKSKGAITIKTSDGRLVVANTLALGAVDIRANGGDLFYQNIATEGALNLASSQSILLVDASSSSGVKTGGDASLVAAQDVVVASLLSQGALSVDAKRNFLSARLGSVKDMSVVAGQQVKAQNIFTNANLTVTAQDIDIADAGSLSGRVALDAQQSLIVGALSTRGDAVLNAEGDITVKERAIAGLLSIEAGGDLRAKAAISGGDLRVTAADIKSLDNAVAGLNVDKALSSGTSVFNTEKPANVAIVATKGGASTGVIIGTGSALFDVVTDVSYDSTTVGGSLTLKSQGDIGQTGMTKTGGNFVIDAKGDVIRRGDKFAGGDGASRVGGNLIIRAKSLTLEDSDYNVGGVYVSTSGGVSLKDTSLKATADAARGNQGDVVIAGQTVDLMGTGALNADRFVQLKAQGKIQNSYTVNANSALEILTAGDITNSGNVQSKADIIIGQQGANGSIIRANAFSQAAGGAMTSTAGNVTVLAEVIDNAGALTSDQAAVTLSADKVLEAGTLSANTALSVYGGSSVKMSQSVISKTGQVLLTADSLINSGTVKAGKALVVGKLASGALTRSASVTNSGRFESDGTVTIATGSLSNNEIVQNNENSVARIDANTVTSTGDITLNNGIVHLLVSGALNVDGNIFGGKGVNLLATSLSTNAGTTVRSGEGNVVLARSINSDGTLVATNSVNHLGSIIVNKGHAIIETGSYAGSGRITSTNDILLITGTFTSGGSFSSKNFGLKMDQGLNLATLNVTTPGALVIHSKSGNLTLDGTGSGGGTLSAGEIELVAGGSIDLTASSITALGDASQGLDGNIVLVADGGISLNAIKTVSGNTQRVEAAPGEATTKLEEGLGGLTALYRFNNWRKRWDEKSHTVTSSSLQAAGDLVLDTKGAVKLEAAKIMSGGGQLIKSASLSDAAVKTGIEKTNLRLTTHGPLKNCAFGTGLCIDAGSAGVTVIETFADEVNYKTSVIQAGASSVKASTQQNGPTSRSVDNVDQGSANVAEQANTNSMGTVAAGAGSTTQVAASAPSVSAQNASVGNGPDVSIENTQVTGDAPESVSVSGPSSTVFKARTDSLDGADVKDLVAEKSDKYTDPSNLVRSEGFIERTGIGELANKSNTGSQDRRQTLDAVVNNSANNGVASIVKAGAIKNYNISGTDLLISTAGDISGVGTQISTTGNLVLASENGSINFDAIKRNSHSIESSTSASDKGFGGSNKTVTTIKQTSSWDYANLVGGKSVTLQAKNGPINLTGTNVTSKGNVLLDGQSVNIKSLQATAKVTKNSTSIGFFYTATDNMTVESEMTIASNISGENVMVKAQDNVNIHAARIDGKNNVLIQAGGRVSLTAARDVTKSTRRTTESGLFVGTDLGEGQFAGALGEAEPGWVSIFGNNGLEEDTKTVSVAGTTISGGNQVFIKAGEDIHGEAANLVSKDGDVILTAESVKLLAVKKDEYARSKTSSASLGFSVPSFNLEGGSVGGRAGLKFETGETSVTSQTHQGSTISAGNNVIVSTEGDIDFENINVDAEGDIKLASKGGSINIRETKARIETSSSSSNGFAGVTYSVSNPLLAAAGSVYSSIRGAQKAVTNANNALSNVNDPFSGIRAVARITDVATSVIGIRDSIKGLNDQITAYQKLGSNDPKERASVTLLNFNVAAALDLASSSSRNVQERVEGSRLSAKGNIELDANKNIVVSASQLDAKKDLSLTAGNNILLAAGYNTSESSSNSASLNARLGVTGSVNGALSGTVTSIYGRLDVKGSQSNGSSREAVVSSLSGKNVTLNAGKNITSQGGIIEGTDVALIAGNKIDLHSVVNSSNQSKNGAGFGLGASLGLGASGISSVALDVEGNVSNANSSSQTHSLARVSGSNSVTLSSGGDTRIVGGVVEGGAVKANVGGNLTVESVIDTASSSANSFGGNFGVTLSASPSLRFGVDLSTAGRSTSWVNEQSAITGSSVDVNVKGNTNLVGGKIAANGGDLKLTTGSLSASNVSGSDKGGSVDFNIGVNLGFDRSKSLLDNLSVPSLGGGFTYVDREQVTRGTIGPGQVTVKNGSVPANLNRNVSKAQEVTRDVNIDASGVLDDLFTIYRGGQKVAGELGK